MMARYTNQLLSELFKQLGEDVTKNEEDTTRLANIQINQLWVQNYGNRKLDQLWAFLQTQEVNILMAVEWGINWSNVGNATNQRTALIDVNPVLSPWAQHMVQRGRVPMRKSWGGGFCQSRSHDEGHWHWWHWPGQMIVSNIWDRGPADSSNSHSIPTMQVHQPQCKYHGVFWKRSGRPSNEKFGAYNAWAFKPVHHVVKCQNGKFWVGAKLDESYHFFLGWTGGLMGRSDQWG